MSLRQSIIDEIDLLAHPSKQLQYEKDVPSADVYAELLCGFCDDLYHPKSEEMLSQFTEDELKGLAHLYGLLREAVGLKTHSVIELVKHPKWRAMVAVAKELNAYYASST
jgi:hypothetical protein